MPVVNSDTYRNTLSDFDEITGGVVRRNGAELDASGGRDTLYGTAEFLAVQGVNAKRRWLADADVCQLRFFQISNDPVLRGNQRRQVRARGDVCA